MEIKKIITVYYILILYINILMRAIFSYKVFLKDVYVIRMSQTDELKIIRSFAKIFIATIRVKYAYRILQFEIRFSMTLI